MTRHRHVFRTTQSVTAAEPVQLLKLPGGTFKASLQLPDELHFESIGALEHIDAHQELGTSRHVDTESVGVFRPLVVYHRVF